VSQASQHQSWAFVGWGGILGRCSTRTEAGSFFDLGMPSTFCIFDVFKLGHWGVQRVQKQVPYFSSFSMGSYGWKNRSKAAKLGQPKRSCGLQRAYWLPQSVVLIIQNIPRMQQIKKS
jgi:hypothetical protein